MNPARNRLGLACALALAVSAVLDRPAAAAEAAEEFPPLKLLDGVQDGMWWHIRKVSPEHPVLRDGSESGCVAIADFIQATANLQCPAGMRCTVAQVLKDRARSAELLARCVAADAAGQAGAAAMDPGDGVVRYTLKKSGDDEIELQAEQGRYHHSSRFLRIGECDP